jgi:quercetin 2,3-dioxygenase
MLNSEVIIYLSENRNCIQTETIRSFITLPNLKINSTFESIFRFTDTTLFANETSIIIAEKNSVLILLPLVGAIEILSNENNKIVNSGEIACIFVQKGNKIYIHNPYENDLINYLEIWVKCDKIKEEKIVKSTLDLEKNKNKLVEISNEEFHIKVRIGKYGGREEGVLQVKNSAFVFVINGVFEVQNRLMESRTGLSLTNISELDFEGLAQENIILIISE